MIIKIHSRMQLKLKQILFFHFPYKSTRPTTVTFTVLINYNAICLESSTAVVVNPPSCLFIYFWFIHWLHWRFAFPLHWLLYLFFNHSLDIHNRNVCTRLSTPLRRYLTPSRWVFAHYSGDCRCYCCDLTYQRVSNNWFDRFRSVKRHNDNCHTGIY